MAHAGKMYTEAKSDVRRKGFVVVIIPIRVLEKPENSIEYASMAVDVAFSKAKVWALG